MNFRWILCNIYWLNLQVLRHFHSKSLNLNEIHKLLIAYRMLCDIYVKLTELNLARIETFAKYNRFTGMKIEYTPGLGVSCIIHVYRDGAFHRT